MAWPDVTPEQEAKIKLVRILVGDTEASIFYPALTDEEYYNLLELTNWNVYAAARRAAMSIAFQLSGFSYRERAGNVEVWNNASLQYLRVLQMFLDDESPINLPPDILPYAAGISKMDVMMSNCNPDKNRSPLAQITPCVAWWTNVKNYPQCCEDGTFIFI